MASDKIFTGHIPILAVPAAGAADGDGDEADDDKSCKASPFSADHEDDDAKPAKGSKSGRAASLPGTPWRPWEPLRECVSDTESQKGRRRRRRRIRERKLDRAWEMRKSRSGFSNGFPGGECLVMMRPRGSSGKKICMDMDEVKACRDLGLEIPRDFTVEIPGGFSGNSSGADSPISGAGEDDKEIKTKLKMWAHTVAFVSSAARSGG